MSRLNQFAHMLRQISKTGGMKVSKFTVIVPTSPRLSWARRLQTGASFVGNLAMARGFDVRCLHVADVDILWAVRTMLLDRASWDDHHRVVFDHYQQLVPPHLLPLARLLAGGPLPFTEGRDVRGYAGLPAVRLPTACQDLTQSDGDHGLLTRPQRRRDKSNCPLV